MGYIRTPLVSLQRLAPGDAVERHVVRGVLAGPDVVVAPVPGDGLGDGLAEWFEVLLASPAARGWNVERIPVDRVEVSRVAGFTGEVATVHLTVPSRHLVSVGELVPSALADAADGTADLWTTLADIGYVPRSALADPGPALGRVAQEEAARHARRLSLREYRGAEIASSVFCCNWLVRYCCRGADLVERPGGDRPGDPGPDDGGPGGGWPGGGPVLLDGPVPPGP